MKKLIILLIVLSFIAGILVADDNYKNAASVILVDSLSFHIDKDMKMIKERFLRIKILEKRGREEKGDIQARFDEDSQKFEIISAHTLTPAGEIIEPEESGVSLVSAPEVGYASQYTNLKMQVISFPALEPNAIIEYNYRIISEKEMEKPFAANITLQTREPIKKKIVSITFPMEDKDKFVFRSIKTDLKPKIIKSGDLITYKFEMNDMAKIKAEQNMPSLAEISPELRLTFYPDWDEFVDNYQKNFFDAAKVSRSIKKQLKKIVGESTEETIENIAIFVKQNIRSIYLGFGESGFEPTDAKKILDNRYGDPQDKAVLLTALLQATNVDAYPVLVAANQIADLQKTLPVPSLMKNILVAYKLNGKTNYIDPMTAFCKPNWLSERFQNRQAIAISPKKFEFITTPQTPIDASKSLVKLNASLDEEGTLRGTFEVTATGYFDRLVRNQLRYKNSDELDILFASIAAGIRGGTDIVNYTFTNPENLKKTMKVSLQFESPNYLTKQGKRLKLSIPKLGIRGADVSDFSTLKERDYDLMLGTKREYKFNASIQIPADFDLQYSPQGKSDKNRLADFNIVSSVENNTVSFSTEFQFETNRVPVSDYSAFRKVQNDYFNQNNWLFIFE